VSTGKTYRAACGRQMLDEGYSRYRVGVGSVVSSLSPVSSAVTLQKNDCACEGMQKALR